ncbi:hypothetical protein FSP39_009586 [Pinctada imbricata]|uniref:DZIP3-like HEPN domain-containing protein n=1 Tax=Pinctada imbricata TaxID=66713 RepID=A0AA88XHI7_PINIB|nr:hypothetical protein FSP39_009586 [Pinctada imbricata]
MTLMNRSQWNQLFIKTSSKCHTGNSTDCPCTYMAQSGISPEVFDVSLCCLILKRIFSGTNMPLVDTIREIRNNLIHASNASLDQHTYLGYWTKVKDAIFDLANSVGPQILEDTQSMVQELEQRVMDACELGELLRILTIDPKRILEFEEQVTVLEDRLEKNDLKFETKKNEESYSKVQLIDLIVRLDFCDIVPLVNEEYNAVTKDLNRISCQLAMTGYHLIHDSPDILKEFNKFHDNCKDFNMMIDESARILRLFYYFDNEDTTGHGKELIKLAENGKEIIKDDPDKFEIFKDKWRRFNELLKQVISFNMWLNEKGATITKQCVGSIVLSLKFDRSENLHSFIDEYKDGVLLQELQRILVTKDFLKSFNLRSAKVNISLEQRAFSPW